MNHYELAKKWLSVFGADVEPELVQERVTSYGNYLWHLFTWGNVPCLEGADARKAFDSLSFTEAIRFYDGYDNHIENITEVGKLSAEELDQDFGNDVYIVAKDFSWTYVRTHERDCCGPYFCLKAGKEKL